MQAKVPAPGINSSLTGSQHGAQTFRAPSEAVRSPPVLPLTKLRIQVCRWDSSSLKHLASAMKMARYQRPCTQFSFGSAHKAMQKTPQRRPEAEWQTQELLKSPQSPLTFLFT